MKRQTVNRITLAVVAISLAFGIGYCVSVVNDPLPSQRERREMIRDEIAQEMRDAGVETGDWRQMLVESDASVAETLAPDVGSESVCNPDCDEPCEVGVHGIAVCSRRCDQEQLGRRCPTGGFCLPSRDGELAGLRCRAPNCAGDLDDSHCSRGERCVVLGAGDLAGTRAGFCQPVGIQQEGDACLGELDAQRDNRCAARLACTFGICRHPCIRDDPDQGCPDSFVCALSPAGEGVGRCLPGCESSTGCPVGQRCVRPSSGDKPGYCLAGVAPDGPCPTVPCNLGSTCLSATTAAGLTHVYCSRFCSRDSDCDDGQRCLSGRTCQKVCQSTADCATWHSCEETDLGRLCVLRVKTTQQEFE